VKRNVSRMLRHQVGTTGMKEEAEEEKEKKTI
jgi:hypothetical protein